MQLLTLATPGARSEAPRHAWTDRPARRADQRVAAAPGDLRVRTTPTPGRLGAPNPTWLPTDDVAEDPLR